MDDRNPVYGAGLGSNPLFDVGRVELCMLDDFGRGFLLSLLPVDSIEARRDESAHIAHSVYWPSGDNC